MKDALTGLDRYEVFLEKLQKEIEQIGDDHILVIYTDIKHFKYINDTYGYKVGNALLKEFVAEFTNNNKLLIGAARVYSDNFVAANRISADGYTNEGFRQMIQRRNQEWVVDFCAFRQKKLP